jgi:hypothetical protein
MANKQTELLWLIERRELSPQGKYLKRENYGSCEWTDNPHDAFKLGSEQSAREFIAARVLRIYLLDVREHMFISEPAEGKSK